MNKKVSKWFLLLIVSSAIFLSVIDLFIVNVAIPSIKKGIRGSDGDIQLVIVLYVIGYAAFLITGGRAGDYFGKKKVFITGILVFTLASCICGLSQNALQINIGRLLQGISAAFMVPQGIAFIPVLFPDMKEREKALGIYGSIAGTASVIGQFLGGILPDTRFFIEGWRLVFLINLPIGILSALLAFKFLAGANAKTNSIKDSTAMPLANSASKTSLQVEVSKSQWKDFNFVGLGLMIFSLISLIYPIIQGRELGWPNWTIVMLVCSLLSLLAFFYNQRKRLAVKKEALINVMLFKNRYFNIGLGAALFYYMVQDSYFLINALQLQTGLGISSSLSGFYFVFQGVGYVVASFISIKLVPRYGKYVLLSGIGIMIISLAFHLIVLKSGVVSTALALPVLFVYGLGCGSVLPTMFTISMKGVPPSLAGAASGVYLTFQQIAIALGVGIVGGIFFYVLGDDFTTLGYLKAYHAATLVNIALLILVGIILCLLPNKKSSSK